MIKRGRNHILSLKSKEGEYIFDHLSLQNLVVNYLCNLYSNDGIFYSLYISIDFQKFSQEFAYILMALPTEEEVRAAVMSMNANKAPDGLPVVFYQKFWNMTKNEQTRFIREVFMNNNSIATINETPISLIPKTHNPKVFTQLLQPIGLCNVNCKIISKIIVNCIKPFLPNLIGEEQSSFISGWHITGNIIVMQEALHSMCTRKVSTGHMAIKVDLKKAYDRLKWKLIQETLQLTGMPYSLILIIIDLVSSVTMRILWNGDRFQQFTPMRGVRQGDPFSLYLFVLCMERLGHIIKNAYNEGTWTPIQFDKDGPKLSHIFFANDLVLFGESSI